MHVYDYVLLRRAAAFALLSFLSSYKKNIFYGQLIFCYMCPSITKKEKKNSNLNFLGSLKNISQNRYGFNFGDHSKMYKRNLCSCFYA